MFLQGNVLQTLLSFHFILDIVNNAPFVATVCILLSNDIKSVAGMRFEMIENIIE